MSKSTKSKQTICLNMIVKNEEAIIKDTLCHLLQYIKFDYWVICDTGSTDSTKQIITSFFKEHNIQGELYEDEWRDFGHNRSLAFKKAFDKTDYVFVWDADDRIYNDFKLPERLVVDQYFFTFKNAGNMFYERSQLFNNRIKWKYTGVLHEYPERICANPKKPPFVSQDRVSGNYYFMSHHSGARSGQTNSDDKYLKDAMILEKAFFELKGDGHFPLKNRYAFYCANSYRDANQPERAVEFYDRVIEMKDSWVQEKYVSCIQIFDIYSAMGNETMNEENGLPYLEKSIEFDPFRVEGIYRLAKYYCCLSKFEKAFSYYEKIAVWYENEFLNISVLPGLFAKYAEHDFYFPYFIIIIAEHMKRRDICVKMFLIICKKGFLAPQWWTNYLFDNLKVFVDAVVDTMVSSSSLPSIYGNSSVEILTNILNYMDKLRWAGNTFQSSHYDTVDKLIHTVKNDMECIVPLNKSKYIKNTKGKQINILFTMTTCKRLDLFTKTVNSILNTWTDLDKVDAFWCVDDNSSEEDRIAMKTRFPFFEYYMKSGAQKGHRESMNILWNKLIEIGPKYWIHIEDDRLFIRKANYVQEAIDFLEKYPRISQVVYNKFYADKWTDLQQYGGKIIEPGKIEHVYSSEFKRPTSGWWPHYTLQPSMTRVSAVLETGRYDTPTCSFELEYAKRWAEKGFKTGYFDWYSNIHFGKLHGDTIGKNAYEMNDVQQFGIQKERAKEREGWIFLQGVDSMGEDLCQIKAKSFDELFDTANSTVNCVAYNTLGYLKRRLQPRFAKPLVFNDCDGLYVRQDYFVKHVLQELSG